jgi:glycine cleavage system H protein
MTSPNDLRYTKTHEWIRVDGDVATIGLTDYAQQELGDITYVELPGAGAEFGQNEPFGVVESVKAASDVFAPVDGEVIERNDAVVDSPELVNDSPYGDAWLIRIRIKDASQVDALMDAATYDVHAAASTH